MIQSSVVPPIELTTDNRHTLPLDCPITLYVNNAEGLTPFTATAVQLTLLKGADDRLKDCHLILSASLPQYQQVLEQSLFHLKPEVRGPLQQANFLPDPPILLELGLQPHFFNPTEEAAIAAPDEETERAASPLPDLLAILEQQPLEMAESVDRTSDFLKTLLGRPPADLSSNPENPSFASPDPGAIPPWRKTDSWLCRSVQQQQPDQTVGYATLWSYTTPEQTEPVMASGAVALNGIATLLQKTTDAVRAEVQQELPHLQQSLSQFSDQLVTALEQVDWDAVLSPDEATSEAPAKPVSAIVKQFFDEDNWAFVQLPNSPILQLAFQGESGRWTCLAQSHDEAAQVAFYSICPITVSKADYGAIAELLMRANDGLVIGNFELDFASGEIRYKTSLDVEGDRLTPALVRQLVYANVQTLDTYLPGILAVLEGRCAPVDAIAQIEQSEEMT